MNARRPLAVETRTPATKLAITSKTLTTDRFCFQGVYVFYLQKDPFFPYRQAMRSVQICVAWKERDSHETVILEIHSED
jgi:hypothetical protein